MRKVLQNENWQSRIDSSISCAESCEYCATYDLQENDVKIMVKFVQTNRSCVSVCWTSTQLMSIDSEIATQLCNLYAEW